MKNTEDSLYKEMVAAIIDRLRERGGELRSRQVDEVIIEMAALAADLYDELERLKARVRNLESREG